MDHPGEHVLTFRCLAYPGRSGDRDGYFAECIDANLMVWRPDLDVAVRQMNDALEGFIEATAALSTSHDEFHTLVNRPSPFWPSRARYLWVALKQGLPRYPDRGSRRAVIQDIRKREPQAVPA